MPLDVTLGTCTIRLYGMSDTDREQDIMTKTYVIAREVFPAAWRTAAGTGAPVTVTAVIVAHRKADVAPLLTDRGLRQRVADDLTSQVRLRRDLPAMKLIAEAGIPAGGVCVLVWEAVADKTPIIRVDATFPAEGATFHTIGRWRRVDGEAYVEALGEAGPCPRCDAADYVTFDRQDDRVTHHVCQDCGYDSDHATHSEPQSCCQDCEDRFCRECAAELTAATCSTPGGDQCDLCEDADRRTREADEVDDE